jgi:hypothetical protein
MIKDEMVVLVKISPKFFHYVKNNTQRRNCTF